MQKHIGSLQSPCLISLSCSLSSKCTYFLYLKHIKLISVSETFILFLNLNNSSSNFYLLTAFSPFISASVCSSNRASLIPSLTPSHPYLISMFHFISFIATYNSHCFFLLLELLFNIFIVSLYHYNVSAMTAGSLLYI